MGFRNASLVALLLMVGSMAANATLIHATRAAFDGAIGASITDDYQSAGYTGFIGDAAMSAVLGETDYQSTGFINSMYGNEVACGGCNPSWQMSFTTTSIGTAAGVYGVAFDYANSDSLPFVALVTFGDDSTSEYALSSGPFSFPNTPFFFGITSDILVKSIHFGLTGGGTTQGGFFYIDNLTIGSSAVPEPTTLALVGLGLAGLGCRRRRAH